MREGYDLLFCAFRLFEQVNQVLRSFYLRSFCDGSYGRWMDERRSGVISPHLVEYPNA